MTSTHKTIPASPSAQAEWNESAKSAHAITRENLERQHQAKLVTCPRGCGAGVWVRTSFLTEPLCVQRSSGGRCIEGSVTCAEFASTEVAGHTQWCPKVVEQGAATPEKRMTDCARTRVHADTVQTIAALSTNLGVCLFRPERASDVRALWHRLPVPGTVVQTCRATGKGDTCDRTWRAAESQSRGLVLARACY